MKNAAEEIYRWAREGTGLCPPAWNELPSIPLYMDQVIFYLKDSLRFFERDEETSLLTSSMINNYVKNGVLPHPDKKKYGKEHLGALMAVCMLKQVLSIQDIKTLLSGEELSFAESPFLCKHRYYTAKNESHYAFDPKRPRSPRSSASHYISQHAAESSCDSAVFPS